MLFYQDFNTLIILDNRLAEMFKIDFNSIQPYKNVFSVSAANDNNVWLFNLDTQILELYDYKNNLTKHKTLPIEHSPLDMTSDYNFCWLITEKHIYKYNYFGSMVYKIENQGFSNIKQSNNLLFLQKNNTISIYNKTNNTFNLIDLPKLLIKQFFVTNESLYIYTGEMLYKFQLKL